MARKKKEEPVESEFVAHEACPHCGSSDAVAVYSDGHKLCWACKVYTHADGDKKPAQFSTVAKQWTPLETAPITLTKRRITERTTSLFKYYEGSHKGKPCHIASYFDNDGAICGQKLRFPDKSFSVLGSTKEALLFGQQLWRSSGRKVVITEGEIDAMSLSQVQENKWPVVSVPNGASGAYKALQKQLEWLEAFEEIVLMFDMDEVGQKAAIECSELFTPGKCKIASLPLKDASEMLQAGRVRELIDATWNAKVHRPDGIVAGAELLEALLNPKSKHSIPYPYPKLQGKTRGIRNGEIVTVTSGSGMGKTQIVREFAYAALMGGETLGYVALEESTVRTSQGLVGLHLNKPIHLEESLATPEEITKAFNETVGSGRVFLYDHFGSIDSDNILSKIRYLVKGCGCTFIVLDHLSMVVSGQADGDERRNIDNLMTNLRSFVEEVQCKMMIISHLKRIEGKKGHEDGAQTALSHLRGSGAIGQLSDMVLSGERNQQDPKLCDITQFRILKNRWTGETGPVDKLIYSHETGRITEYLGDDFDNNFDSDEEGNPF